MNRDRAQEFYIDIDGIPFQAVRVVQYVHIGGEYDKTHGFPYCPTKIFTSRAVEGLTVAQANDYAARLIEAIRIAATWEAERRQQEKEREAQS